MATPVAAEPVAAEPVAAEPVAAEPVAAAPVAAMICERCEASFDNEYKLRQHQQTVKDYLHWHQYECHLCERLFKSRPAAKQHFETGPVHSAERMTRRCGKCNEKFTTSASALEEHWASAEVHRLPFVCTNCDSRFQHMHILEAHEVDEHGHPYACDQCAFKCTYEADFDKHVKSKHGHACETCGRMFKSETALDNHVRDAHRYPKTPEMHAFLKNYGGFANFLEEQGFEWDADGIEAANKLAQEMVEERQLARTRQ